MNDDKNAATEVSPHPASVGAGQSHAARGTDGYSRNDRDTGAHHHGDGSSDRQFSPLDALPFLDALGRRWVWILVAAAALAGAGFAAGKLLWKDSFTATAQLLRQPPARVTEVLGEREMASETYASLLRAPELLERVAARSQPPVSTEFIAKRINITPERNSDVILLAISTDNAQAAVNLANLYATEAVRYTQELQTNSAARVSQFVSQQLAPIESEIATLSSNLNSIRATPPRSASVRRVATASSVSPLASPLLDKLQAARMELADLSARYTDQHPIIQEQRAKIAAIESQMPARASATNVPSSAPLAEGPVDFTADTSPGSERESTFIQAKLQALENSRLALVAQKQAAVSLERDPPGTSQVLAPATIKEVISHKRAAKVAVLSGFGGMVGLLLASALVLLGEAMDTRLKTTTDVKRVTKLPVLATAGDLGRMTDAEQKNWAFRTWTKLQGALSSSQNKGFVCGFTSSEEGEGRSTWVRMLAEAASQRGFRVLTIVATPPEHKGKLLGDAPHAVNGKQAAENDSPEAPPAANGVNGNGALVPNNASNVLTRLADVTEKLTGPNSEPVVEIPLPGWVWNLERRKQWQEALRHWSQIDNIALIVELPPASMPETVLLAENIPNLIWLADGGKATAEKTCDQLETLRNAHCHLAGAVMNRTRSSRFKHRFARWIGCFAIASGLHATIAQSQEQDAAPSLAEPPSEEIRSLTALTNRSFSVVNPAQRAEWQKRLTLGPGDVVNIALWGEPALTHNEVAVGPDGRISFAEAQAVVASGLTLDELREKMNEELAKYRRFPKTMITPVAFRSKKYYLLGRVMTKGVYTLDRPTTILEAVARAHGFETGLVERNIIDVADFSRSFLMRRGKRIPLNFEKLFQTGDLSQNLSIEPGDYIYFPGTNVKEVYVVGEVRLPGSTPYTPELTLMQAISARAGYTERAYRGHVLVVRGGLDHPQKFVVETKDVLAGRRPDFELQPRDIIFVNSRPLIYVEELADLAITAFLQSIITATVGQHLIQPFQEVK